MKKQLFLLFLAIFLGGCGSPSEVRYGYDGKFKLLPGDVWLNQIPEASIDEFKSYCPYAAEGVMLNRVVKTPQGSIFISLASGAGLESFNVLMEKDTFLRHFRQKKLKSKSDDYYFYSYSIKDKFMFRTSFMQAKYNLLCVLDIISSDSAYIASIFNNPGQIISRLKDE